MVRSDEFTRDWTLRWVRGSMESYIAGRTRIGVVKGKIRRAVRSYGIRPKEVGEIISLLQIDPSLNVPKELREERVRPLLEFIKELEEEQ